MRATQERLTLFSYFGGKARFCKEIAELLDYENTDIYIEPFGGAASVLLNKPTHGTEIYSDASRGLVALMTYLSDPEKAPKLIDSLYDTVYSVDCFNEWLEYRNSVDDNYLNAEYKKALKEREAFKRKIINRIKRIKNVNLLADYEKLNSLPEKIRKQAQLDFINEKIIGNSAIFTKSDIKQAGAFEGDEIGNILLSMDSFDLNENTGSIEKPDPLKLAVATYVVYSMSRDGMGTAFSTGRFHSSEAYYKQIDRLYRVAERLNGVQVIGAVGALTYLLDNAYLDNPRAMFYIDAPYLSADENEKNLGVCYKGQMELSDHELLLKTITNSEAKFLISNYDTPVYNKYLGNWTKVTIDTVTGVGSKKNNKRTECLWYNY